MKRIALTFAIAALAAGASTTAASGRLPIDGDEAAANAAAQATHAAKKAKPAQGQQKDVRPAKVVYLGRH